MIRISIHLPARLRLELNLIKSRKSGRNPFVEKLGSALRARTGNKLSRLARHVFEHKNVRKFLGANLAVLVIASSLLPGSTSAETETEAETIKVVQTQVPMTTQVVVQFPVTGISITQGFRLFHPGLDFDGLTGDEIKPAMAGKVEDVTRSNFAYGNAVIVNHGSGKTTLYAHLSKIYVAEGQDVTTKDVIGEMGTSGRASGDHLHFEVRQNGIPVNPYSLLPQP